MVERNNFEQTNYQCINVNYSFHEIKPGKACKFNLIIIGDDTDDDDVVINVTAADVDDTDDTAMYTSYLLSSSPPQVLTKRHRCA